MPGASEIAASLCRTPLLSIAELQTQLDGDRAAHGIYAWWLVNPEALPGVPTTPHPSEPVGLLYIGIGPGAAGSSRTLRARVRDHARDTGRSTLRRALASFLYEQHEWRPYFTDRPLLAPSHEEALTAWVQRNLRVQWVRLPEPWVVEADMIALMRPPAEQGTQPRAPLLRRGRRVPQALP